MDGNPLHGVSIELSVRNRFISPWTDVAHVSSQALNKSKPSNSSNALSTGTETGNAVVGPAGGRCNRHDPLAPYDCFTRADCCEPNDQHRLPAALQPMIPPPAGESQQGVKSAQTYMRDEQWGCERSRETRCVIVGVHALACPFLRPAAAGTPTNSSPPRIAGCDVELCSSPTGVDHNLAKCCQW